jgi:hypothetical protein
MDKSKRQYTKWAPRCSAISRRTGGQCGRAAMPGKKNCRYHDGGNLEPPIKKGERRALKTGQYVNITGELSEAEKQHFEETPFSDKKAFLETRLKLLERSSFYVSELIAKTAAEVLPAGKRRGKLYVDTSSESVATKRDKDDIKIGSTKTVTTQKKSLFDVLLRYIEGRTMIIDQQRRICETIHKIEMAERANGGAMEFEGITFNF